MYTLDISVCILYTIDLSVHILCTLDLGVHILCTLDITGCILHVYRCMYIISSSFRLCIIIQYQTQEYTICSFYVTQSGLS